ncbi:hypothetical protein, partial [Enterobacter cloacae complex sp. 4DZ1-17B1]|uniref:hypothetical protein n=1 Tax=Enterobacter cloacae complex sp. 4DZ1-17B1 TaxID=2511991 RepID=UPI001CA485A6
KLPASQVVNPNRVLHYPVLSKTGVNMQCNWGKTPQGRPNMQQQRVLVGNVWQKRFPKYIQPKVFIPVSTSDSFIMLMNYSDSTKHRRQ